MNATWRILEGDAAGVLRGLPERSVHTVVTSPPYYGLRDYDVPGQIGLEATPDEYVAALVAVFREVRRVLRDDGTVFLNLGDSYASAGQSRPPRRAPAYGSDGIAPQGSPETGSACRDLCDGCRAATQNHHARSADTGRHPGPVEPPPSPIGRDTELSGSGLAPLGASLLGAQASTTPRSSEPRRGACSHCSNCGACLAVLRSSSRDARVCARTARHTNDTGQPASESGIQGMDALGTAWLNYKAKDLLGIPWLVAFALRADGWYLRSEIILAKRNPMPESVRDRPTRAHEQFFLLAKRPAYFYDADGIREPNEPHGASDDGYRRDAALRPVNGATGTTGSYRMGSVEHGRNKRSVWWVASEPFSGAHFAVFGTKWIEPCILAGAPERACGECGAPWTRVVEGGESTYGKRKALGYDKPANMRPGEFGGHHNGIHPPGMSHDVTPAPKRTVGWEPSCEHGDGSAAGVVLDPFAGAGTTGVVALRQRPVVRRHRAQPGLRRDGAGAHPRRRAAAQHVRGGRMNRAEYDAYLRSAEWRKLRKRALRRAEQRCQLCNGEDDLHVHHRTYERVGEERITDLTVLCGWCHAKFHDVERKVPRAEQYDVRWRRVFESGLERAEKLEFWSSLRRADLQRLSYAQWDQQLAEAEQKPPRRPTPSYSADAGEPNREGVE